MQLPGCFLPRRRHAGVADDVLGQPDGGVRQMSLLVSDQQVEAALGRYVISEP